MSTPAAAFFTFSFVNPFLGWLVQPLVAWPSLCLLSAEPLGFEQRSN